MKKEKKTQQQCIDASTRNKTPKNFHKNCTKLFAENSFLCCAINFCFYFIFHETVYNNALAFNWFSLTFIIWMLNGEIKQFRYSTVKKIKFATKMKDLNNMNMINGDHGSMVFLYFPLNHPLMIGLMGNG